MYRNKHKPHSKTTRNLKVNLIRTVTIAHLHRLWSHLRIQQLFNSSWLWVLEIIWNPFLMEEAQRNHGWRLQICELQLYPLPAPFSLLSQSMPLKQSGGFWGYLGENWWFDLVQQHPGESDPVAPHPLTTLQHEDTLFGIKGASKKAFLFCTLSSSICLLSQSRIWRDTKLIKQQKHMGR